MVISRIPTRPRIALYSHDAQGLGHIRRNMAIAGALAADGQRDVLLISGAREAGAFALPAGVELLTLPALRKSGAGRYRSRSLALPLAGLIRLRAQTICAALQEFAPDVLIVDKLALGIEGELEPALQSLAEVGTTRLVLGLRDVLDDPRTVRHEWSSTGSEQAIRELYDAIWVYGDRSVYDPVVEYGLDRTIAAKVRFSGYLGSDPGGGLDGRARAAGTALPADGLEPAATPPAGGLARPATSPAGELALCLVGGGQDGFELASAFARAALPAGASAIVVTGPFMPADERERLDRLAGRRGDLRVLRFVDDPGALLRAADRVVCMGGYNTVCELLHLGRPALVVPRIRPRLEQRIRAERLAARGVLDVLHPDWLTPAALGSWLSRPLAPRAHPSEIVELDGLRRLPALLADLCDYRPLPVPMTPSLEQDVRAAF